MLHVVVPPPLTHHSPPIVHCSSLVTHHACPHHTYQHLSLITHAPISPTNTCHSSHMPPSHPPTRVTRQLSDAHSISATHAVPVHAHVHPTAIVTLSCMFLQSCVYARAPDSVTLSCMFCSHVCMLVLLTVSRSHASSCSHVCMLVLLTVSRSNACSCSHACMLVLLTVSRCAACMNAHAHTLPSHWPLFPPQPRPCPHPHPTPTPGDT